MQGVHSGGQAGGKDYRKVDFYWAVIYGNHIKAIYPRHADARTSVVHNNARWEKEGWGRPWRIVRFRYHFKGTEIDAYAHYFERSESPLDKQYNDRRRSKRAITLTRRQFESLRKSDVLACGKTLRRIVDAKGIGGRTVFVTFDKLREPLHQTTYLWNDLKFTYHLKKKRA